MARFLRMFCMMLVWLVLAACTTSEGVIENGPRLISEVTLPPVTTAPTRALSPSPGPTRTDEPTDVAPPPLPTETDSAPLVISPTAPPSKTPTITPSVTVTQADTATPLPTPTDDPRPTAIPTSPILVPTMVFMPPPVQVVAQAPDPMQASPAGDVSLPLPGLPDVPAASCSVPWFFSTPRLPDCPPNPAMETQAATQFFQYGKMFWIGSQDAIYVLYESNDAPRWQVFQDTFEDGMPESDPGLNAMAPPYANWQPRRGFGLIWRNQPNVLARIGWAESAYEQSYNARVQTRTDGTIFLNDLNGRVYALSPNGNWAMYGGG